MNNAIRSQYVLIRNKWRNDFTLKSVAEVLLCPRQNIQSNQVKYGKTFSSLRKMNNRSFHLSVKNFSDKVHSTKSESEDNIDSSSLETQKEDELKVDVGYKLGEENNDTVDDNENIENIDISKFTHKIETKMPDLDVDGKIVQWFKEKGDIIHKGDLLCDVETELFTFTMESDDEGITIMGDIYEEAGGANLVQPGTPICSIYHETDPTK